MIKLGLENSFNSLQTDAMLTKKEFYMVDEKLVVNDPSLGVLQWNTNTSEWEGGPSWSSLYENASSISQHDIISKYHTAIGLLDLLSDSDSFFIEKIMEESRQTLHPEITESRFLDDVEKHPGLDKEKILEALSIAKDVHDGQLRSEGTPFISHCIAVARSAIQNQGDTEDVIVCLLHDSYEDFEGNREDFLKKINKVFTKTIVDSIVKLSKYRGETKLKVSDYLQELSQDNKNLKRKGFDRLNNLVSLRFANTDKREKYLLDTQKNYIPLFMKSLPEIGKKMQRIVDLYKQKSLSLLSREKKLLNNIT